MKARLPKGYGGPSDMGALARQAQKMQEQMAETTAQLEETTYTATAGGGVVNAEEVEAAAFIILAVHSGGLGVLGAVAVDEECNASAGLFAAGNIEAAQQLAALGAYREALLRSLAQSSCLAVTVNVIIGSVGFFIHDGVEYF